MTLVTPNEKVLGPEKGSRANQIKKVVCGPPNNWASALGTLEPFLSSVMTPTNTWPNKIGIQKIGPDLSDDTECVGRGQFVPVRDSDDGKSP